MANEYLTRTPTSTGNRKVFTFALWLKRNILYGDSGADAVFNAADTSTNSHGTDIRFRKDIGSSNDWNFYDYVNGAFVWRYYGNAKYRDSGNWFHAMFVFNSTDVLAQNRVKVYINGVLDNNYAAAADPSQNYETYVNSITEHYLGVDQYDGSLTTSHSKSQFSDVFLVDGQALTPDVFGFYKDGDGYISAGSTQATDFRPGQWVPKSPSVIKNVINNSGGFGVNGFYLPMNEASNFGADFHCEANSIITLKGEDLPQPENGAPVTTDAYVSQLRSDPFAANLVLAVPGISTSTSATLVTNGTFDTDTTGWTLQSATGTLSVVSGELYVEYSSTNGTNCYQAITTEVGKRYTYVVTSRTTVVNQPAKFSVGTTINGSELTTRRDNNTTTNETFSGSFTATTTTTYITLGANFTADAYFDNIVVKQENVPLDYSADIKGSGTNKTLTATGNAGVGYEIPGYYGSAMTFDGGTNESLDLSSVDADLQFGSDDFTMECWVYNNGDVGNQGILGSYYNSQSRRSVLLYLNASDALFLQISDNGSQSTYVSSSNSNPVRIGQWNHVVGQKEGSTISIYLNGVCAGIVKNTYTSVYTNTNEPFQIGAYDTNANTFNGQIQDVRVYKGVAKYKGGFDVPKPYTPVGIGSWRAVSDTCSNNFATLNPLQPFDNPNYASDSTTTLSNGNLSIVKTSASSNEPVPNTMAIPIDGKFYYELYVPEYTSTGVRTGLMIYNAIEPGNFGYNVRGAKVIFISSYDSTISLGSTFDNNGAASATELSSTQISAGDIVSLAVDLTSSPKISFFINGTEVGYVENISRYELLTFIQSEGGNNSYTAHWNFGQNPTFSGLLTAGTNADDSGKGLFKYAPPTGFLALCEDNLPTPTIADPGDYMRTVLWEGDGNNGRSITGVGFKPDLVWVKGRNLPEWNNIYDVIRGADNAFYSNSSSGEESITDTFYSFDDDGFSVAYNSAYTSVFTNKAGSTYAAWCWKAGGAAVTNTDGTITSQVSANQTAGFSIVSYTGNGVTGSTVGHGLGKTPALIIIKQRNASNNWAVWINALADGNNGTKPYGYLDLTNTWNISSPADIFSTNANTNTSSVFYIGSNSISNDNTDTYISYCWAEIEGFSKFGSYTGNGSADGPFVYCGFKPSWIMVKRTDGSGGDWAILDSSLAPVNTNTRTAIAPNDNRSQGIYAFNGDFVSNGFKVRVTDSFSNASNGNYIFAAFAESPFKTANAK